MACGSQKAYVSYSQAINEKERHIKKDSTLGWRRTVRHPAKMWQLAKWTSTTTQGPLHPPQFPPLKDWDSNHHSSNVAKAEALADCFFPPPVAADLTDRGPKMPFRAHHVPGSKHG